MRQLLSAELKNIKYRPIEFDETQERQETNGKSIDDDRGKDNWSTLRTIWTTK